MSNPQSPGKIACNLVNTLVIFSNEQHNFNELAEGCVLHVQGDKSTGKLIPFTEKTLTRCKETQKLRQTLYKESKFNSIVLPAAANGEAAYHAKCLKYFNAVKPAKALDQKQNMNGIVSIYCVPYYAHFIKSFK